MKFTFDIEVLKDNKYIINNKESDVDLSNPRATLFRLIGHSLWNDGWETNGLYNKNVHWPEYVEFAVQCVLSKKYVVVPSRHMFNKLRELHLPRGCYKAMLYGTVVEAEMEHGEVVKIITRLRNVGRPYEDICAAIIFKKGEHNEDIAFVKTIWTNKHDDNHSTINMEHYVKG